MKKSHIAFLTLLLSACFAYADNDKLNMLEQEVQRLTNEVEILKHELHGFKNQLTPEKNAPVIQNSATIVNTAEQLSPATNADKPASDKQRYEMALVNLRDKNYDKARSELNSIISHNPKGNLADKAMFWYAETFFRQKDFQSASLHFLKCYKAFPKGEKASDSLLKLALSISELKEGSKTERDAKVCKIINKLDVQFPKRSAASQKTANDLKVKHNCQ